MTENIDAYYTLEELFILTDILEDKTYDLRYWENIELIVSKLNCITGNAIRLQKENEQLKKLLSTYKEMHSIKIIEELQEENKQLKGEVKRLKCINKQLEDRLDRDIALSMDCGDV